MPDTDTIPAEELLRMTSEVAAAYVSNNNLPSGQLPDVIRTIHESLAALSGARVAAASEPPTPAVAIKKSITPDYIVCLEDGKRLKMLKRHLMTHYNMTPDQYRQKWGLGADYPMVAPNYAEQRRSLAKSIGLGTKRRKTRGK